jgi:hypothetical protein
MMPADHFGMVQPLIYRNGKKQIDHLMVSVNQVLRQHRVPDKQICCSSIRICVAEYEVRYYSSIGKQAIHLSLNVTIY